MGADKDEMRLNSRIKPGLKSSKRR